MNTRTFKFRCWNIEKYVWHNTAYLECADHDEEYHSAELKSIYDYDNQHKYIIQQFTGLKDTNDVDIYEGDLVEFVYANQPDIKDSKGVYEVFYSQKNSAYYLRVRKKNWLDTSFVTQQEAKAKTIDANCPAQSLTELPLSQFKICRVIGNIFEHKEEE